MTFKKFIWKNDILLNINVKINIMCISIQMNCKWKKFQVENLLMFEDFISNLSHLITICHKTKPLEEKPSNIFLKNLHKLEISLKTYNSGKKLNLNPKHGIFLNISRFI